MACRRAAEYELRRLQRHIEACERRIAGLERDEAAGWHGTGERERKVIARLRDVELPHLEERLRELLDAGAKVEPR